MSDFIFNEKLVHYETYGNGEPLMILNGIMMSTKSWMPFIPSLSMHFQVILVDFFDQGQSDRLVNQSYTQEIQVDLIKALIEHLKLDTINLVGISYGGEVALQFAIKYQSMLKRMILFNTCAYTSPWLKEIGRSWIETGKTRNGQHYYQTTIPVIYSPHFYEEKIEWMKKREAVLTPIFSNPTFLDQMERLTLSAESHDVRERLNQIQIPVLIVAAEEDYLTPVPNQTYLHEQIKQSLMIKIPFTGHASMYEKPLLFTSLLIGFFLVKDTNYPI